MVYWYIHEDSFDGEPVATKLGVHHDNSDRECTISFYLYSRADWLYYEDLERAVSSLHFDPPTALSLEMREEWQVLCS